MHHLKHRQRRAGLTLLELLVVLTILAVLATLAVQATDQALDQSRYEVTVQTLATVEAGVLGTPSTAGPGRLDPIVSFVSDMGRLPIARGDDPLTQLQELWDPTDLPGFDFRPAAFDSTVVVPGGWRGPYLRLPIGATELRDGWGNEFVFSIENNTIRQMTSLGSDDVASDPTAVGFDRDLSIDFAGRFTATVSGRVGVYDASMQMFVPPNPNNGGFLLVMLYGGINEATGFPYEVYQTIEVDASVAEYEYILPGVTIGERAIRAYQVQNATPPFGTVSPNVSPIVRLQVPAGGMYVPRDLTLPAN